MRVRLGVGSTATLGHSSAAPVVQTRQPCTQHAWRKHDEAPGVFCRCISTHQQPSTSWVHARAHASSSNQVLQHAQHPQLQPNRCHHVQICTGNQQAVQVLKRSAVMALNWAGQRSRIKCCSSGAGSQNTPAPQGQNSSEATVQQQQQQQPLGQTGSQGSIEAGKNLSAAGMPHLLHMQPPPQPIRVPPLLSWLPPWMVLHLQALAGFLQACWELLPQFVAPTLPEALRRLVLVLGASLVMIVVVSTIDSGWLYLYLQNARRVAVAA